MNSSHPNLVNMELGRNSWRLCWQSLNTKSYIGSFVWDNASIDGNSQDEREKACAFNELNKNKIHNKAIY